MIYSMTGFASKTCAISTTLHDKAVINLQLKTLNSRFFESQIKMSHCFSHLETKINTMLKHKLKRGFVTFNMYIDNKNLFKSGIQADISTIKSYKEAISTVKQECNVQGDLTLHDLITLPNIFISNDLPINESIEQQLLTEVDDLIIATVNARALEGAVLSKDLQERFGIMEREIRIIEQRSSLLIIEQKEKIAALDTLLLEPHTQPQDEARKITLYTTLDKMDIHEEIIRFKNHLKNSIDFLSAPDAEKGKRLDFTMQELGREINTISAKCADGVLITHAINIKVEIEKAREQAQNII